MSSIKFYIDINYPKRLVDALVEIHNLQKEKRFELVHWKNEVISKKELKRSVFLLVDYKKTGLDITTKKHFEDGYRVVAFKVGKVEKLDRFEFAMTVLRVWPFIVEKANQEEAPFMYSFRYGGRKLQKVG